MSEISIKRGNAPVRLYALDLCRGLCAVGVAAYHFSQWGNTNLPPVAQVMLALLGTYGVSLFFVLIGYSLAHAYENEFQGRVESGPLGIYIRRRIGRLAPLFCLVLSASLVGKAMLGGKFIDVPILVVNVMLLFGFVNPIATPVIGGWSIGVEVVFYVLFPLLMILRTSSALMLACAALLTAWISISVADKASLADAWSVYVHPANHWIFFCAGVYARLNRDVVAIGTRASLWLIALSISVALAVSMNASELELVSGWRRFVLVPICIAVVFLAGILEVRAMALRFASRVIGGASYPLHLIHPLVFFTISRWFQSASVANWLGLLLFAVLIALLIDNFFDSLIQRRIKRFGW